LKGFLIAVCASSAPSGASAILPAVDNYTRISRPDHGKKGAKTDFFMLLIENEMILPDVYAIIVA